MSLLAVLLIAMATPEAAERLTARIETCRSHREAHTRPPPEARCAAVDADVRRFLRADPPLQTRLAIARALSGWAD